MYLSKDKFWQIGIVCISKKVYWNSSVNENRKLFFFPLTLSGKVKRRKYRNHKTPCRHLIFREWTCFHRPLRQKCLLGDFVSHASVYNGLCEGRLSSWCSSIVVFLGFWFNHRWKDSTVGCHLFNNCLDYPGFISICVNDEKKNYTVCRDPWQLTSKYCKKKEISTLHC